MTYLPCLGHVIVIGFGIVALVKFVSLKHTTPSSRSVELDMYNANPRNLAVYALDASKKYSVFFFIYIGNFLNNVLKCYIFKSNSFCLRHIS